MPPLRGFDNKNMQNRTNFVGVTSLHRYWFPQQRREKQKIRSNPLNPFYLFCHNDFFGKCLQQHLTFKKLTRFSKQCINTCVVGGDTNNGTDTTF